MNFEQFAMAGFVLIGLVNGIKLATDQNWKSFALFVVAVVAGTVFGAIHWFGLPSAEIGLAVGISSSGVYTVAKRLGGE